jgi:hypothetical protein
MSREKLVSSPIQVEQNSLGYNNGILLSLMNKVTTMCVVFVGKKKLLLFNDTASAVLRKQDKGSIEMEGGCHN